MASYAFSCFVDNDPALEAQAFIWVNCLKRLQHVQPSSIFVHTNALRSRFRDWLDSENVSVVEVERFDGRNHYCNKIQQLETFCRMAHDQVVFMDCDTAWVGKERLPLGAPICARIADFANPPELILATIFSTSGLGLPDWRPVTFPGGTGHNFTDVNNCNGGVYICAGTFVRELAPRWRRWAFWCLDNIRLFESFSKHADQVSFALAMRDLNAKVSQLPLAWNYPTHVSPPAPDMSPQILHYHSEVTRDLEVKTVGLAAVDQSIEELNTRIAGWDFRCLVDPELGSKTESRDGDFDLKRRVIADAARPFEDHRVINVACEDLEVVQHVNEKDYINLDTAETPIAIARQKRPYCTAKVVVGSGWWCDESPHDWALGSAATRSAAFFEIWHRQVLRSLRPDRIVITDSASPIKPDINGYDGVQWIELDRNYGHANDIRTGRIHAKYSGFTRSVINGAMYALCCDADFYVYVEQDCLLYGEDLLKEAIGDSTAEIVLGSPTQNGKGIGGLAAAPMVQQSLIIVRRSGLERFLTSLLGAPTTDGEVSPEENMRTRLAPFDFVRIPFGRSRPIDFDRTHFYAQHLDDDELERFQNKLSISSSTTEEIRACVRVETCVRPKDWQISIELQQELQEWKIAGKKPRFWWRDDDAASNTPELDRLLRLAGEIGTVVALAVIPERANLTLAKLVNDPRCCIWQHGWSHHWQLEETDRKYSQGEFVEGRDLKSMMADAQMGQMALNRIFGEQGWQKVFVPPFHALSVPFKMLLPSLGYCGVSAGDPLTPPISTVVEVNAEIDIMDWPQRKFRGSDAVGRMIVKQLALRRQGEISTETPIGILSHHLAHDEAAWQFVSELFHFLKRSEAAEILPANLLKGLNGTALGVSRNAGIDWPEAGHGEVTVVVTSCGRQDLLEITLDSFLRYNTFPIREFIVIEDGDGANNKALKDKYCQHPFRWLATGKRVGQVAAIDIAYQSVRTEYIFHCEDDWEFYAPGFIERSISLLAQNRSILQVWIRALNDTNGHPTLDYTLNLEGVPYRLLRHHHDAGQWGVWHGLSWNPGLRRLRDYRALGSFGSLDPHTSRQTWQVEADASAFYQQQGFFAAILADNGGNGYARHIGKDRRVSRDYLDLPGTISNRGAGAGETGNQVAATFQAEVEALSGHEPDCVRISDSHNVTTERDHYARVLTSQLAAHSHFACLIQNCQNEQEPGVDEALPWRIWTDRVTTRDQLMIEEQLEGLVTISSSILHIGAGNSSLGRRFASRVSRVLATALHDEERIFAEGLGIKNYAVVTANKFSEDMDRIGGEFDFIVDNNPSSFACCLFHFSRMMISYAELLKRNGGQLLTAQPGLSWVSLNNDPYWSFNWSDWVAIGRILGMPVRRVTDSVYSMQCLPQSGIAPLKLCNRVAHGSSLIVERAAVSGDIANNVTSSAESAHVVEGPIFDIGAPLRGGDIGRTQRPPGRVFASTHLVAPIASTEEKQASSDRISSRTKNVKGENKAIIVMGMHRSGTSALSRVISFYGFDQPKDLMPPLKDNPKGYWESIGIQELNYKILASLGGAWDNPGPFLLPGLCFKKSRVEIGKFVAGRWREEALRVIQNSFGEAPAIVLKDPRISLFLPLWQGALESAGYRPSFVLAYRNPLEVAASLSTRDGVGLSRALRLWLQHNFEALLAADGSIIAAVDYADLLNDPDAALAPLFATLSPPAAGLTAAARAARTDFLSATDRHHLASADELESSPFAAGPIRGLWKLLRSWNLSEPSARASALLGLETGYQDVMLLCGGARMVSSELLGDTRTPTWPIARSALSTSVLRARIFTTFGTVVYVDAGGQLRHGPIEISPKNAAFVADLSWNGSRRRGSVMYEADGNREPIACFPTRCVLASTTGEHDRSTMQTVLDVVPLERGLTAFVAADLFLCAEPDGRITLSRKVCSIWECFMASENWCAGDPSGLPQPLADIEGMNIDGRAIESFTIPEVLRTAVSSSVGRTSY